MEKGSRFPLRAEAENGVSLPKEFTTRNCRPRCRAIRKEGTPHDPVSEHT